MNANKQVKEDVVAEISRKVINSKSIVVARYAGLTVKEMQNLRAQLREAGVDFKVYKNRLFKLALEDSDYYNLRDLLVGQNAFAFGLEDDISPAKILANFAKEHEKLELIAGTFEGEVIDQQGVMEVAILPTMEEALTKLALALITPLKDISIGLNMLDESHLSATPAEEAKTAEENKEENAIKKEHEKTSNNEEKEGENNG